MCADGWGAGFYVPDDPLPCLYRSTLPIWADSNRAHLGRALRPSCALACVRSATDPLSVAIANTPPFSMGSLALVHNGYIENFASTALRELERTLPDEQYNQVRGRTDSEYALALLADLYARSREPSPARRLTAALRDMVAALLALGRRVNSKALLTFIVSDGQHLVGTRAALGLEAPTLYRLATSGRFAGGSVLASEPLDDDPSWRAVEPGELWLFSVEGTCEQSTLA